MSTKKKKKENNPTAESNPKECILFKGQRKEIRWILARLYFCLANSWAQKSTSEQQKLWKKRKKMWQIKQKVKTGTNFAFFHFWKENCVSEVHKWKKNKQMDVKCFTRIKRNENLSVSMANKRFCYRISISADRCQNEVKRVGCVNQSGNNFLLLFFDLKDWGFLFMPFKTLHDWKYILKSFAKSIASVLFCKLVLLKCKMVSQIDF